MEIVTADYLKSSTLLRLGYSLIRISRTAPQNLHKVLIPCEELYPTWYMIDNKHNPILFEEMYVKQVLSKLDPYELCKKFSDVSDKIALLCWEPYHEFCHRHVVRKWFVLNGIAVSEFYRGRNTAQQYTGFKVI